MPFYPDNIHRAGRLQQLVNSIANLQTDVEDFSEQMDRKLKRMKEPLQKLLKDEGIDSIDVLLEKSQDALSPDHARAFQALVKAAKDNSNLDWEYLLGAFLSLPILGKTLNASAIAGIGRFAVRASGVEAISKFFLTVQKEGAAGAGAAAQALVQASEESEKALQEAATAVEGATGVETKVAAEVAEAGAIAGKIAVCVKALAVIGFVATIIMSIIELVEGAKQKTKLISAIHECQPARLCIAFYREEANVILQQAELCVAYVEEASKRKEDPDSEKAAQTLGHKLIDNITSDQSKIDWRKLERNLEAQDKKSEAYYGDDDLDFNEVLRLAREKEKE